MKVACTSCGGELEREKAWQRFTMLRKVAAKGGGRQRTMGGHGAEEYFCDVCARLEDLIVKRGPGFVRPSTTAQLDLGA